MVCRASEWVLKRRLENCLNFFAVGIFTRIVLNVSFVVDIALFDSNFRLFMGLFRAFDAKIRILKGDYPFLNQFKMLIFNTLK